MEEPSYSRRKSSRENRKWEVEQQDFPELICVGPGKPGDPDFNRNEESKRQEEYLELNPYEVPHVAPETGSRVDVEVFAQAFWIKLVARCICVIIPISIPRISTS